MCTSETTCVLGNVPALAREVALPLRPDEAAGQTLSPPFRDPEDATERSCSVRQTAAGEPSRFGWLALVAALFGRRRASRVRAARATGERRRPALRRAAGD
jgi:hypothetical protein